MKRARVVIVGGGPAGISTALFLAHSAPELASDVVVLERARYPREKFCAGAIGRRADRALGSIGVTIDVPSVWLDGVAFRAQGRTEEVREGSVGRVVRRLEFDEALAKAAMSRGIEVRQGVSVAGIRPGHRDVEVECADGELLRAAVVVGADGVQSIVRRGLGLAASRFKAQAVEVDTEMVDSDLERDVLLFDASHRELPGYYWDFPTIVDGRELMCRGVYFLRIGGAPTVDIHALLDRELEARGLTLRRYRIKRFAERGFEPHAPISRPGVLLVGEAAGIDPITGEGIAQAVFYGKAAGRYLARKIVDERDVRFDDWPRTIRKQHVGRDLVVRTLGLPLFYGPRRPAIEDFVLSNPDFVRVGLQHFAGKSWSRKALLRAGTGALRHTLTVLARGPG